MDAQKRDKAKQIIDQIPESYSSEVKVLKANILLGEGKTDEAEQLLDSIEDKDELANIVDIAYMYIDMGYPDKALSWLNKGLNSYSEEEAFLAATADCFHAQGLNQKAETFYNKLIDKNPYSAPYWFGLARCYFEQQLFDKAIEACDYAIVADEEFAEAYIMKGHAFYQLGNEESALENYTLAEKYKAINPDFLKMFMGLNEIAKGHWEEGYQYIEQIIQSGDIDFTILPSLYAHAGLCLYKLGKKRKANQYFKESTVRKRMVGLYGEFRASYKNLVYLTVTGRNDWSSTLPVNNRSYFYPSVSGSFVFTELLPKNNVLSFGKIRASWARVGKDADAYSLGYYMWPVATLNGGKYGMGNSWTGGSVGLKPEIQDSYELGLEMRFFNGRLGFDYTYYQSKTKDQICAPRLAQSTGYIFLTLNGGSVENKGMELSITGKPIVTRDFQWETTLNLSGNRGRLGDFIDGVDIFYVTDAQIGAAKAGSIPNGGYFLGLTGNKYETAQGPDGKMYNVIDASTGLYKDTQVETNIVGNREPKLIGGFNNSFSYKNFNLSFLFDIRLGGDIYNGTEYYLVTKGLSTKTINRESVSFTGVVNTGTTAKPAYETKTITYNANETYQVGNSTRSGKYMIQEYYKNYAKNAYNFITDTNWLRLRSISLSYDFKDLLKKQNIIKGLTATITGTNLFVWTNYKGMDPETCVSGSGTGGSGSAGIDYCGVPATAGMSFGINLTF